MPNDRTRDEHGDFANEYSTNRFLDAVRRLEPVTTKDVSDDLGCHRNTAYYRLDKLEEQGKVEKEDFGRTFVWRTI